MWLDNVRKLFFQQSVSSRRTVMSLASVFGRPRRAPRVRARTQLHLELLEDRSVPSTGPIDVIGHLPAAEYNQFIWSPVETSSSSSAS